MKNHNEHLGGETIGTAESAETPQASLEAASADLQALIDAMKSGAPLSEEQIAAAKQTALEIAQAVDGLEATAPKEVVEVIESASAVVESDMETAGDPEVEAAMKTIRSKSGLRGLLHSVKNFGKKVASMGKAKEDLKPDLDAIYTNFDINVFEVTEMEGQKVPADKLTTMNNFVAKMIELNRFEGDQAAKAAEYKTKFEAWITSQNTAASLTEDAANEISELADEFISFCENSMEDMGAELDAAELVPNEGEESIPKAA